jgi:outer membrane protein insertion porin family
VRFSPDKKWAYVTYRISEGEKFTVGKVSFTGNKVFTDGELYKDLKTKPGEPVSKKNIRQDVMDITEKYADKGYAVATVNPELKPDIEKKTVDIVYHIEEGDIYKIGRVEISGNIKTKDMVIRREVLLNEGDTFSAKLLKRSYQRINNLNFFENVSMQPEPIPDRKQVNLLIDVKEKQTGFISVGGGYSSVDALIGTVDFTQANLAGTGQAIRARGELGGRTAYLEFSYKKPWFLDKPMDLTLSVYDQRRDYLDYTRKAVGFDAGLSRNFLEYWYASMDYRLESAKITDVLSTASSVVFDQIGTRITSSVTPGIARDTRDNFLDPHSGSRNSISSTFAGIGGTNKFYKVDLDSAWFFPIGDTTFSVRGRYGHGEGISGRDLPLYERYYVGGIYTVRGLGYGEGGPTDPSNGEPIGGKNQVIFNTEYVFPLISEIKLKSVVFFDAGKAYDTSLDGLRYTSGFGIRWISPLGPIRVEYGFNLHKHPGEKSGRIEFAFGSFF